MKCPLIQSRLIAAALASCVAPSFAVTSATPVFFGPSAYLSQADIPVGFYFSGSPTVLENFEDGVLDASLLGTAGGILINTFSGARDSVDGDDGVIDGTCGPQTAGRCASWFGAGGEAAFRFVGAGALPTAFGLVWTDGGGQVTFRAVGAGGLDLGSYTFGGFADNSFMGTTGEDRFFGLQYAGGISAIHISNSGGAIEVDHVQFGQSIAPVPEPGSWALMAMGLAGLGWWTRRRGLMRR